jgi:hypothetical protein
MSSNVISLQLAGRIRKMYQEMSYEQLMTQLFLECENNFPMRDSQDPLSQFEFKQFKDALLSKAQTPFLEDVFRARIETGAIKQDAKASNSNSSDNPYPTAG